MRVLQHLVCCGAAFFALGAFRKVAFAQEGGLGTNDSADGQEGDGERVTGDSDGHNRHQPEEVYFVMDESIKGEPFTTYGVDQHHLGRTTRPLEGHIIATGDRASCNPVTNYGVCLGTDEKPGMVMEATGFMLRHATHPKYSVILLQIVRGDDPSTRAVIDAFDHAAGEMEDSGIGFARADTSIADNWRWATDIPGFDLRSHAMMLKVSGFGTSLQHYGAVKFESPSSAEASAVRVEMHRCIKTAMKHSVLIPHLEELRRVAMFSGEPHEVGVMNVMLEYVKSDDDKTVHGEVEVREGSIMKAWKRKQLSMARGLMTVSSPHGEIHKQKSISLDGMVLERGCKSGDDTCFTVLSPMKKGRKSVVVLEVRAPDARAADNWLVHATVQQRLAFYSHRFAPFADVILPGAPDLACDPDPVHIVGVDLDVVDSPASVNCMIDLTPQEMEELGISDLDAVLVDVHHSDWVAMNAARAKMKEICRVHPTGAIARRPTFYEVVKETLETFRSSGVVKATGSTWRKPPVAIPSSLYGRRSSVGSRSRKGWHGGARQDKTATSPTRTAPSYRNNGGDTAAAASVVDAVDDEEEDGDVDGEEEDGDVDGEEEDGDVDDEEEDQHWDATASRGVDVDDDVKLDCAVSLPADQMTALELGRAGLGKSSVTVRDKSRSIEKTCIVVEDADLPKRCIGTCEGLRKELGLSIDVDDDDQLTVLRPSLYPSPAKDQFSSRPLRLDSLACDDLPLCDGEHLFSSSGIQASCAWVTPEGCFRAAGGHAPSTHAPVVWEVGAKKKDAQAAESFRTEVTVHRGQLVITDITPASTGGFFSRLFARRRSTFVSPRPRSQWKTRFSLFSREGRAIRDAQFRIKPDGTAVVETPDGELLWEVDPVRTPTEGD